MNDGIVRKGKVSFVDTEKREVRVYFLEDDFMSGWLKVLKNTPFIPSTEKTEGGVGDNSFALHSHDVKAKDWLPEIDDTVICIYETGFNGDGYVLGAL